MGADEVAPARSAARGQEAEGNGRVDGTQAAEQVVVLWDKGIKLAGLCRRGANIAAKDYDQPLIFDMVGVLLSSSILRFTFS